MVTRSRVLAVSSARLRLPTTRRTSPSLLSWYKLCVSLQFNLVLEGFMGERKPPGVKNQRVKSLGQVCSQFCIVYDFTPFLPGDLQCGM